MSDGGRDSQFNVEYDPHDEIAAGGGALIPPHAGPTEAFVSTPRLEGKAGFRYFSVQEVDPVQHLVGNGFYGSPYKLYEIANIDLTPADDPPKNPPAIRIVHKVVKVRGDGSTDLIPVVIRMGGGTHYVLDDQKIVKEKDLEELIQNAVVDTGSHKYEGGFISPQRINILGKLYIRHDIALRRIEEKREAKILSYLEKEGARSDALIQQHMNLPPRQVKATISSLECKKKIQKYRDSWKLIEPEEDSK